MSNYVFIDFEFNQTAEPYLNLVCCSLSHTIDGTRRVSQPEEFWLHNFHDFPNEWENADDLIKMIEYFHREGYIFVAYAAAAEARAFMALCRDYRDWYVPNFKWIDLFFEHRQLTNHFNKLKYGKQLIKGQVVNTFPPKPKWERIEGEKGSQEPVQNFASACYKFLGIIIDTKHKDEMRDLIISNPENFTHEEAEAIQKYCTSDIIPLPDLFWEMARWYTKLLPRKEIKYLKQYMLLRGDIAARIAIQENTGYPIDYEATKSFSDSVPMILSDLQRDINSQFEFKPFRWSKKDQAFKWRQKATREFLEEQYPELIPDWMLTKGKALSLSLEAFSRFFSFQHSYPRENFGAQMVRYLKTKQNLNGFLPPKEGKKNFWDSVGSDQRVRPYLNPYRAQSSRFQPSATSFMFLKSAWMRALVVPPPGRAICGIDWGSQEFLIGALLSGDKNMMTAYHSGDPYMWFAKAAKAVPHDGRREDYEVLRQAFKSTTLAEMYLMGIKSLARKITDDTGEFCSDEKAEELDELFRDVFFDFCSWRMEQVDKYEIAGHLKLPDGWFMFGDNDNFRSTANCPVQGTGASILRKSMRLAQDAGLDLIFPLHDAQYQEFDSDDLGAVDILHDVMDEAFRHFFPRAGDLAKCRLDIDIWSRDYPAEVAKITTPAGNICKRQQFYVDGRAIEEYKRFSRYFNSDSLIEML